MQRRSGAQLAIVDMGDASRHPEKTAKNLTRLIIDESMQKSPNDRPKSTLVL